MKLIFQIAVDKSLFLKCIIEQLSHAVLLYLLQVPLFEASRLVELNLLLNFTNPRCFTFLADLHKLAK